MKKYIALLLALVMALSLCACGSSGSDANKATLPTPTTPPTNKVGVSMPTKDLQRWNQDGANMEAGLKSNGYEVDLQYAGNDIPTQVSQIENMIAGGCSSLVIAAIDGESLGTVLAQARKRVSPSSLMTV